MKHRFTCSVWNIREMKGHTNNPNEVLVLRNCRIKLSTLESFGVWRNVDLSIEIKKNSLRDIFHYSWKVYGSKKYFWLFWSDIAKRCHWWRLYSFILIYWLSVNLGFIIVLYFIVEAPQSADVSSLKWFYFVSGIAN